MRVIVELTDKQFDALASDHAESDWKRRREDERQDASLGAYVAHVLEISALTSVGRAGR